MADHPVMRRYEAHCDYIRHWCNRPPDEDLVAHQALASYRPPGPELTPRIQMLMDDMALAIQQLQRQLGAAAPKLAGEVSDE